MLLYSSIPVFYHNRKKANGLEPKFITDNIFLFRLNNTPRWLLLRAHRQRTIDNFPRQANPAEGSKEKRNDVGLAGVFLRVYGCHGLPRLDCGRVRASSISSEAEGRRAGAKARIETSKACSSRLTGPIFCLRCWFLDRIPPCCDDQ